MYFFYEDMYEIAKIISTVPLLSYLIKFNIDALLILMLLGVD